MKAGTWWTIGLVAVTLLVAAIAAVVVLLIWPRGPSLRPSFDGDSTGLKQTQIVPTLDTPIEPGKNVLWCATLQAAWKDFQNNIVKAALQVEGNPPECGRLNAAPDPLKDLPRGEYYVATGSNGTGATVASVNRDMRRLFPDEPPLTTGTAADSFVLYGFLKTSVPFKIPYFENDKPFVFTDSAGAKTALRSFGIRSRDHNKLPSRADQVGVLYAVRYPMDDSLTPDRSLEMKEFALDLCKDSQPNQLIVACIPRLNSLGDTLSSLDKKIAENKAERGVGSLLVPDIFWRIIHHYSQFEGRSFLNPGVAHVPIGAVVQQIEFRLDKSGAMLSSRMWGRPASSSTRYYLDKPFLIVIKHRNAARPFFVLWVNNAELLQKWRD